MHDHGKKSQLHKVTNAFTGLPSFLNSEVLHAHGGQLKMNNDNLLGLPWLG